MAGLNCVVIERGRKLGDGPKGRSVRYFIRRASRHVKDHAWEMEDKDLTGVET